MQTTASPAGRVALFGYLANFVVTYVITGTLLAVVVALMQIKGSALGVMAMMVSVMPAMLKFVKVHQRGMTKAERLRFAAWGMLLIEAATVAMGCLFVVLCGNAHHIGHFLGMVMSELQRSPVLLPMVVVFGAGMQFGVLYFATGLFGRQVLKAQTIKAATA
jgi:hypothetical protein